MKRWASHDITPSVVVAAAALAVHVLAITQYGYFRDEFYYLACSRHLAFGFVDHPPFADAVLWAVRHLFGESLVAIRIIPILVSCSLIVIASVIARELGGGRYAMTLAAIGTATAPVLLGTSSDYSMNTFDQMFWTLSLYFFIRFVVTRRPSYFMLMGIMFGIGLETKHLIIFLMVGLTIGIALTEHRTVFRQRYAWMAVLAAVFLFLPNALWLAANGFPNFEFARNAAMYKNTEATTMGFIGGHLLEANPPMALIIVAALWFFFIAPEGKSFRAVGIAYIIVLMGMIASNGKTYYIAPMLPVLFAAGSVIVASILGGGRWAWLRPMILGIPILTGLLILPLALPILSVDSFLRYQAFLGLRGIESERHEMGPLPQHYADMFGWKELAAAVTTVYRSLPDSERTDCTIFTTNYGRAGAIEFFGASEGLPKVLCGHNNYWLWGPGNASGSTVIIAGGSMEDHVDDFESVRQAGESDHPLAMPYERHCRIFVGRHLKAPIGEIWDEVRHFN